MVKSPNDPKHRPSSCTMVAATIRVTDEWRRGPSREVKEAEERGKVEGMEGNRHQ